MEEKRARAMLQAWAAEPITDHGSRSERNREKAESRQRRRVQIQQHAEDFIRRNLITIMVILAFALEGWAVALYTERRVTREVTESVTAEMRRGFQSYLAQQEAEKQAAAFLSGEASLQAATEQEATALARLLYGYRSNSLRDRRTLIWCVLARVDNPAYPGSVEQVIAQQQQWMFYGDDNPVREDDRQLALAELQEWHGGKYPAGFSSDFVYAEWTATDIALRDAWEKNSTTHYWRMPEE